MKRFIICSVVCLVAFSGVLSQGNRDVAIDECGQELNTKDVEKFHEGFKLEDYLTNKTDEITCMMACYLRKKAQNNGTTLYKGFLGVVDSAYKNGFENDAAFKRKDVDTKIENCFLNEKGECAFFKCVDPFSAPFAEIFLYEMFHAIGNSILEAILPSKSS